MELALTPLQPVSASAGTPVFLKREDLLPYGGGNKVRRFRHFLAARPACTRVAAMSDFGSHTFAVLARMRADPALALSALTLYERRVPSNPHRERLARTYTDCAGVEIHRGRGVPLWIRWQAAAFAQSAGVCRLGIGGRAPDADGAYASVVDECIGQLADAGVGDGPVAHVFPVASGDMAAAFLRQFDVRGLAGHRVLGVMTGPAPSRAWLRRRHAGRARFTLREAEPMTWTRYLQAAHACHAATGVWLDPVHAIHAWEALRHPTGAPKDAAVVLWVTCMHMDRPPS